MSTLTPVSGNLDLFVQHYAQRQDTLPGGDALRALRQAAIERFTALGFPTTRNEEWKYTNLAPHLKAGYELARPAEAPLAPKHDGPRLVFVNGYFAPELSRMPEGVKAARLRDAILSGSANGLGSAASFDNNALVALNTALFSDGAYVEVAAGAAVEEPLHLLYLTSAERPSVSYPRTLIRVGANAQVQIVEEYSGSGGAYFTNAVTEIEAAQGAVVEHYKLQSEGEAALHFGHLATRQERDSTVRSFNIALGAALARNEISSALDGEGAHCALNGLYVITGRQHVDNFTTLHHIRPHATSHELYKGVLDGRSEAVFHGRIIVQPEAQKTDAIQRNRNLLLSKDAVINTKPQLEIYADDVRCTHGATVGQVDEDAVFYLRSRGIALAEARNLLTYAFASEVIDEIKVDWVKADLGEALFRQLAQGRP